MQDTEVKALHRAVPDASQPTPPAAHTLTNAATAALASSVLAACGGGEDAPADTGSSRAQAQSIGWFVPGAAPSAPRAWRLLMQGTMGPTLEDLTVFSGTAPLSYDGWLALQMDAAKTPQTKLLDRVRLNGSDATGYERFPDNPGDHKISPLHFFDAWWYAALKGKDQLRQRVAFALSEIFVVSLAGSGGTYAAAHYYDTLAAGAFGSWADLIKSVCTHPSMGCMLSHLSNQPLKQAGLDGPWGNRPDQNFARELLQLFSIGLYELKNDGTLVTNASGKPIETYTTKDIEILASIFTGWSWNRDGSLTPERGYFNTFTDFHDELPQVRPMMAFPEIHEEFTYPLFVSMAGDRVVSQDSTSVTVRLFAGRNTTNGSFDTTVKLVNRDPQGNLDRLLAMLGKHPNVAPFLARQMIQRLVTSNPSSAYIGAVATAFKSSGFNMGKLVRAVLLDYEAIDAPTASAANKNYYGKVREPVLRMTHLLRAFKAQSYSGRHMFDDTSSATHWLPSARLGQAPMSSPTVFNFFRPGYRFPGTVSKAADRVAPEMQIHNESSAAGYIFTVKRTLEFGFGRWSPDVRIGNQAVMLPNIVAPDPQQLTAGGGPGGREDIELDLRDEYSKALADASANTTTLLNAINQKLCGGLMSTELRTLITNALNTPRSGTTSNPYVLAAARVRLAILLTATSPEFIVQQ